MTSLATLMRYPGPNPLGGVIVESGMFILDPPNIKKDAIALKAQGETPIFIYHGDADTFLNIDMVYSSYYPYVRDVVYKPHPENYSQTLEMGMTHEISRNENVYVTGFIKEHVKKGITTFIK